MRWATSTWNVLAMTRAATRSATAANPSTRVTSTFPPSENCETFFCAASSRVSASAPGTSALTSSSTASALTPGCAATRIAVPRSVSDSDPPQRRASAVVTSPAPPLCDQADAGSDAMPDTTTSSSTVRQTSSSTSPVEVVGSAVGPSSGSEVVQRTCTLSPTPTPRASAVAGGSAICPLRDGTAPSSTTSELSRGSSVVVSMSCHLLVPPLRISIPLGASTSAAWTPGRARTDSSSSSDRSPSRTTSASANVAVTAS